MNDSTIAFRAKEQLGKFPGKVFTHFSKRSKNWHKITIGAIDHFPLHVVHNQENGFEIKPILVITRVECNAEEGIHRRNNNWIKDADKIANVTVDPHPLGRRRKHAPTVQIEVPAEILRAFPFRLRRDVEIRLAVIVRIKKDHLH